MSTVSRMAEIIEDDRDVEQIADELLGLADEAEHDRVGAAQRDADALGKIAASLKGTAEHLVGGKRAAAPLGRTRKKRVNSTSAIKRTRRTRAEMEVLRDAIVEVVQEFSPCTVRQTFYQVTVRGYLPKVEKSYRVVQRLLLALRRDGRISYDDIVDNTRWQRKPDTYTSIREFLREQQDFYRRDLWASQDAYVEIWLEKDALAGCLTPVTYQFDVPLMVAKGFSSASFLNAAARAIEARGKPAYVYALTDHDPSGVHISRSIEAGIRKHAPDADVTFERIALTPEQVERFGLPTRPTKKSDTRSRKFRGESTDLDALPPDELRRLVQSCIERHIDTVELERVRMAEQSERETLQAFLSALEGRRR